MEIISHGFKYLGVGHSRPLDYAVTVSFCSASGLCTAL